MAVKKKRGFSGRFAALLGSSAAMTLTVHAQTFPEDPPCPTSQLAPFGINVDDNYCIDPITHQKNQCLLNFANFKWWTGFQYVGANYGNAYFYNGGLGTTFAPQHAYIDPSDKLLHLKVNNDVKFGGPNPFPWSGAEVVLMFDDQGKEANLGYGEPCDRHTEVTPAILEWS